MINSIAKITLYVNNQEEAKVFWTEKMNFAVSFEQSMGPNMKWLEVAPKDNSDTVFVLYDKHMMKEQNPQINIEHPSIILSTKDIEKAHSDMEKNGVKMGKIENMPYGNMFHFYDMDGNMFLLRED